MLSHFSPNNTEMEKRTEEEEGWSWTGSGDTGEESGEQTEGNRHQHHRGYCLIMLLKV